MDDRYRISLLAVPDVDVYGAHIGVHDRESGTGGDLPYGPYRNDRPQDPAAARAKALQRWGTPVAQAGWRRIWGLWCGDAIVGSVHLAGGELEAGLHRADLGLGIERPHRGLGYGRRLMEVAIAWARAEPAIDWIDLGVFVGNDRAAALYRRLGFVHCGLTVDRFRVDGLRIDDVQMALWVGAVTPGRAGPPAAPA